MLLYIASDTFSVLGQAARVYLRGCPSIFGDSLFILFLIHLREHLNSLLTLIFKLHLLLALAFSVLCFTFWLYHWPGCYCGDPC